MGTVSPTQVSDNTGADASDINTPINQLANVINGNIDADNIADNAVTDAKRPRMKAGQFADSATEGNLQSTYTILNLDEEDYNPESWTLSSNMVTLAEAGLYLVFFKITASNIASGEVMTVKIVKNSGGTPADFSDEFSATGGAGGDPETVTGFAIGALAANDTLEIQGKAVSGDSIAPEAKLLTIIKLSD